MKNILKLEELAMFGTCIFSLALMQAPWWWYLVLLLGPDISMIAYSAGNKAGAACYNLFHHKGIAILIFTAGLLLKNDSVEFAGIALFGHSSLDRLFGYGLKLIQGFKYTHLGIIGEKK